MRLAFVTPVHRRFALTAICLEQRHRLIEELAKRGIEAHCVVLGNDDNLKPARAFGFHVLERPNDGLGRRWNDGIEFACRELGVEYVTPLGSDDWAHPDYFDQPALPDAVRASTYLGIVHPHGTELTVLRYGGPNDKGFIPWLVPTTLLKAVNYRPDKDHATNASEHTLSASLLKHHPDTEWIRSGQPHHIVDFKSMGHQITGYGITVQWNEVAQVVEPFTTLAQHYPHDLVERMQRLYHDRRTP